MLSIFKHSSVSIAKQKKKHVPADYTNTSYSQGFTAISWYLIVFLKLPLLEFGDYNRISVFIKVFNLSLKRKILNMSPKVPNAP